MPQNPVVQMASDPVCAGANKDGAAAETFVVDGGGLENVFVYIKDDLGAKYAFETPATPVKIEQKGCHYVPHVAGIRAGQPLEISNDDSTMHTVHGMGHSNQEFNFSQPLPGIKNTVALTTTEVLMPVKCDVHPWMHAYIGVVNHPFFAVSAGGGKFDLRGRASRHLHRGRRPRKARHAEPDRHDWREGKQGDHVHVQGSELIRLTSDI